MVHNKEWHAADGQHRLGMVGGCQDGLMGREARRATILELGSWLGAGHRERGIRSGFSRDSVTDLLRLYLFSLCCPVFRVGRIALKAE